MMVSFNDLENTDSRVSISAIICANVRVTFLGLPVDPEVNKLKLCCGFNENGNVSIVWPCSFVASMPGISDKIASY